MTEETAQTAETAAQEQGSAPETNNTQETPAKVDGGTETAKMGEGNDIPSGLKKEMFALRQERRENRAKLQQMETELNALKSKPEPVVANNQEQGSPASIFDDPDRYLASRDQRLISSIDKLLDQRLSQREQAQRRTAEADDAGKWLLSQKDFKDDPDALDEIHAIIDDPEIQRVASVSPKQAAKLAYSEWRERKGLNNGRTNASGARAGSVSPSGTSGSGQKVFTRQEIEKYLDPQHPDFNKRFEEVKKAQVEGRIK